MFSCNNQKINLTEVTKLLSQLGSCLSTHELTIDSRKINNYSIFCAYPGTFCDGRDFIKDAVKNGADVILYEDDNDDDRWGGDLKLSQSKQELAYNSHIVAYKIHHLMHYIGVLAAAKYNYPSASMCLVGVTGTNGKTSISYWLNQVYTLLNKKSALIGTLGAGVFPKIDYTAMTTPDPITLQSLLSDFVKQKVAMVAMEVSSHALAQGRVNGISFKTAIFTNLTQDHLDYHKNMENYYLAKRELFYWRGLKNIIINIDDKYGERLYLELHNRQQQLPNKCQSTQDNTLHEDNDQSIAELNKIRILSYGIDNSENHADVVAKNIRMTVSGTIFTLCYQQQSVEVHIKIIGKFNIYNLLAVAAELIVDNYPLNTIAEVLQQVTPVCGRMDAIMVANKPLVIIDFAHTPDSLEQALTTLQEIEHSGKIYCVFGCGGNRDRVKRPIMGKIAVHNADFVVITSDNPRDEDPDAIIDEIITGIDEKYTTKYNRIASRQDAIKAVIKLASSDDIVLIAGKGHEEYQEISGHKVPFSDFKLAKTYLNS